MCSRAREREREGERQRDRREREREREIWGVEEIRDKSIVCVEEDEVFYMICEDIDEVRGRTRNERENILLLRSRSGDALVLLFFYRANTSTYFLSASPW